MNQQTSFFKIMYDIVAHRSTCTSSNKKRALDGEYGY
jgi:hypothetical protein